MDERPSGSQFMDGGGLESIKWKGWDYGVHWKSGPLALIQVRGEGTGFSFKKNSPT